MAQVTMDVQRVIAGWRAASDEIRHAIGQRAWDAAEAAASRITSAYPRRSGLLQSSVRTGAPRGWSVSEGAVLPARRVIAGHPIAPHIHFIEDGIAGVARARVGPRPTFVPIVVQEREAFIRDAQRILDRPREVV